MADPKPNGANPIAVIAEALARVEYKLDLLMSGLGLAGGVFPPMHFIGQMCPACKSMVEYQIDLANQVVTRKCGCRTGKQPPMFPLTPMLEETKDADAGRDDAAAGNEGAPRTEDRPRRQGR